MSTKVAGSLSPSAPRLARRCRRLRKRGLADAIEQPLSIAQHDAWFNEVVKPNLPAGLPEPTFATVHYSNTKK